MAKPIIFRYALLGLKIIASKSVFISIVLVLIGLYYIGSGIPSVIFAFKSKDEAYFIDSNNSSDSFQFYFFQFYRPLILFITLCVIELIAIAQLVKLYRKKRG